MEAYKIKQIIETNRNVNAIFVNNDGTLYRDKIYFFALVRHKTYPHTASLEPSFYDDIEAIAWCNGDKCFDSVNGCVNFLGLEFDNKEEDWTKEIKEYLKKKSINP